MLINSISVFPLHLGFVDSSVTWTGGNISFQPYYCFSTFWDRSGIRGH